MDKILALTNDGRITFCTASEDQRGKGRCNHISHQGINETSKEFTNRISKELNKNSDIQQKEPKSYEDLVLIERKLKKLELSKNDKAGEKIVGNQVKYFKDNNYIKLDDDNHTNGLSEEISSIFLDYSNLEHAKYTAHSFYMEELSVDMQVNCVSSPNFLKEGEQLLSFYEIMSYYQYNLFMEEKNISKQFDMLVNTIKTNTGLDCKSYLIKTLVTDILIKNPDRHLNNLSLIKNKDNIWKIAPCYDNGLALLANYKFFPLEDDEDNNWDKIPMMTFSSTDQDDYINLIQQKVKCKDDILQLDFDGLKNAMDNYSNYLYKEEYVKRSKKVLMDELIDLEDVIWIRSKKKE